MINSVTVINHRGESKKIVLADPEQSGFAITNITGLGPPNADIHTTELSSNDGAVYNSARATSRNIVISFVFFFSPTIEAVRLESYKFFPIKKFIILQIETDTRTYIARGYVESNIPTIFSNQEGCDISILCPSAYFNAIDKFGEYSGEVANLSEFEFPFSNESLSGNMIEFGIIRQMSDFEIFNPSTVETGFVLRLRLIKPSERLYTIILYKLGTDETMVFTLSRLPGGGMQIDDELVVSTIPGSKRASLLRNRELLSANAALSRNSKWLQLDPGINVFRLNVPLADLSAFEISYEFSPLYEGV